MARELTERDASAELSIMASWVLVPYADLYPDVNVEDYVATSGRAIVREMTQRCLSEPGLFVSAITSLGVSADRPLYPADLTGGAARAPPRAERRERTVGGAAADRVGGCRTRSSRPSCRSASSTTCAQRRCDVRWVPYQRGDHRSLHRPVLAVPADAHAMDAGAVRPRTTPLVSDCARAAG